MKPFNPILLALVCALCFSGCGVAKEAWALAKFTKEIITEVRRGREEVERRRILELNLTEEQKKDIMFYQVLRIYQFPGQLDEIRQLLREGQNPNWCNREGDWRRSNPLLLGQSYSTYYRQLNNETVPDPTPDVELLDILIEYGADITLYPYVYVLVYDVLKIKNYEYDEKVCYVKDDNRILKAYLEKGADVNAKGNAKAFDWQTYNPNLTYEEFQDLCKAEDATTPLYEAIKKGMIWESQVDLLLEYGATLDESCLEAARLSGDEAMVEKVERLMKGKL